MGLSTGSTLALYLSVFLSCVSFAIIMPSIWPYMSALHSSKSFLAWVVASYSFGEAFGALSLGYSARFFETQHAMAFAAAIGAAGSVLYMIAGNFPQGGLGLWFVFLGRFAQGVWTGGSQAIQTAYLGKILPVWSLTPTIVTLRASASLGFILGPVFGLALNVFPLSFQASLAAPGGFVLLSALLMAFLFLKVFDEQGDRASLLEEYINTDTNMDLNAPTESDHLLGSIGSKEEYSPGWPDVEEEKLIKGLGICNLTVFSLFAGFAIQETITT